jgi:hypothetical protein
MTALAIALSAAFLGVVIFIAALRRSSWRGRKPEAEELKRAQFELRWARQLSGLAETLIWTNSSPVCSRVPRYSQARMRRRSRCGQRANRRS